MKMFGFGKDFFHKTTILKYSILGTEKKKKEMGKKKIIFSS